jgi:hypothetical protein
VALGACQAVGAASAICGRLPRLEKSEISRKPYTGHQLIKTDFFVSRVRVRGLAKKGSAEHFSTAGLPACACEGLRALRQKSDKAEIGASRVRVRGLAREKTIRQK